MISKRTFLTLAVIAAASAAAWIGATTLARADTGAQKAEIPVVFSNISETPTLDPAIAFSSDGFEFVRNVYEGLLEYVPGKTTLRPLLATRWSVSKNGRTYTFTIRRGVKFHDGATLDAAAVKLGLERIKAVNQGPATLMTNVASIAAPSSSTLVIRLKQPDVYFLGKLPKLPIVSPRAIREHRAAGDPWATKWFATNEAGTGPYVLDSWQRNSSINLKKFDGYWRPFQRGTPTRVSLRLDADVQTALQLLARGEIDMMGAVGPDDSVAASKLPGVKLVKQPAFLVQTIPLNVLKGPLKDLRVRKAIALAFNYEGMKQFYKGLAKRANGPLPSDFSPLLAKQAPVKQNLAEAKRLLRAAGYGDGFEVTYLGLKGLSYEEFAGTLLQSSLGKVGIRVKQTLVPWPQMVEIMSKPGSSLDMSFLNMSALTNDPTQMLSIAYASSSLASKGGYNWSYYSNPKLDAEIRRLSTIRNATARDRAVARLNKKIANLHLALYIAQPILAQPVRKEWKVTYDNLDYNYVVRFFYARKT
ncbi:MAG TPA: ABC transporter substrate-binding protein [Gaiellaceae bacterium]|nr:ABC transporter substrate-binding protein [Gaiellaceae bacterium]